MAGLAAGAKCPGRSPSRSPTHGKQAAQQSGQFGAMAECAAAADEAGGQYKPAISPKKEDGLEHLLEGPIDAYESDCEDSPGEDSGTSPRASSTSVVDVHWDGLGESPQGDWSGMHFYPEAEWVHVDDIDADFPFASSDVGSDSVGESASEDWVLCPAVG